MNIVLIGLKNSGKTSVGKVLAELLNWQHQDTDYCMLAKYQYSPLHIYQLYQELGAKGFREYEQQIYQQLIKHDKLVISTGGGLMLNIKPTDQNNHLIYLYLSKLTFLDRLAQQTQATYLKLADAESIYVNRHQACQKICHHSIDASKKSVTKIATKLRDYYYAL